MENNLTKTSLIDYLMRKLREVEGASMLISFDNHELDNLKKSEVIERVVNFGRNAGILEGKIDMIREMMNYFELNKEENEK